MNKEQISRLEMLEATSSEMEKNRTVWDFIPIVGKYKNELDGNILSIKGQAEQQQAAQVFISKSLTDQKRSIAEKMAIIDDSVEVFAEDKGDTELMVKTTNTKSDYYKLSHEEFEVKVTNVIGVVESVLPELADYGITVTEVELVKEEFNDFQEKRGKPRAYRISSRVATQQLKDLFEESAVLLGKMDKILNRFKLTNPPFYNGYVAARKVINK
ncbi:MAG: hypothetical protein AAFQ94_27105 [Bacteroidota bacterium]